MLFSRFATHLKNLESTTSRLKITAFLAELFKELKGEEIKLACYLLLGSLTPVYQSLEFQMSVKSVIKALAKFSSLYVKGLPTQSTNLFGEQDFSAVETQVSHEYKKIGDLGSLTEKMLTGETSQLMIKQVYEALKTIAQTTGTGSQEQKQQLLIKLLTELDSLSAKYVVRMMLSKLRLGFSTMTILDALSWTVSGDKSQSEALEEAYNKKSDIGELARGFLAAKNNQERSKFLSDYTVAVGIPVLPALCQRLNSAAEVIEKMPQVLVEPKYDGMRVQIHWGERRMENGELKKQIKIFTRSMEDVTHMYPEAKQMAQILKCQSCVLDGEAIGFDKKTGKLVAFQQTITRKRKHAVTETSQNLPLRFFIFDLLSLDGKSLLTTKLRERKDLLKKLFQKNEVLIATPFIITDKPEEITKYHQQKLAEGLEGVVIKQVDSIYQSGRKGWNWVKIKELEGKQGKLNDTIDAVVMGYYFGKGKRTKFGLGAFLVGIVKQVDHQLKIVTVCKIGTGLTDEQFYELKRRCQSLEAKKPSPFYEVHKNLIPDVWVDPGLVVEIAADEITTSPVHSAGVALRFPRLVKFRDDKSWEQATSLAELNTI